MSWMKDIDTDVEEAVAAFDSASGTRMTVEAKSALIDRAMAMAIAQAAPGRRPQRPEIRWRRRRLHGCLRAK